MPITRENIWTTLVGVAFGIAWLAIPAEWHARYLAAIVVGLVGLLVWVFVTERLRWRRSGRARAEERARLRDAPGPSCPACGRDDHDYKSGGLWDGFDTQTGARVGGCFTYAICKRCGTRWGQQNGGPPYVSPDDEWDREVT